MHRESEQSPLGAGVATLSRRQILRGGALAGLGLLLRPEGAEAATAWSAFHSKDSGASISYPETWLAEGVLVPALLYPRQSFAVLSASQTVAVIEDESAPDLRSYPKDAVVSWLLHYDEVVDGPPFAGVEREKLTSVRSKFDGFSQFGGWFAGSERTFLLRVWVGSLVSQPTLHSLERSLRSISVP